MTDDLYKYWYCPNCNAEARSLKTDSKKAFHPCPKIPGLMSPMLIKGQSGKIVARVREDYVGKELVQCDANGRPIMSVVVTRDEGEDVAVYPGTAQMNTED